jgi:hypothetical protein
MIGMEGIIAAVITGIFSLVGIIVTVNKSNAKLVAELKAEQQKAQAVTDLRLDELTREVREHNNFAKRMPAVETEGNWIKDKIEYLHRD